MHNFDLHLRPAPGKVFTLQHSCDMKFKWEQEQWKRIKPMAVTTTTLYLSATTAASHSSGEKTNNMAPTADTQQHKRRPTLHFLSWILHILSAEVCAEVSLHGEICKMVVAHPQNSPKIRDEMERRTLCALKNTILATEWKPHYTESVPANVSIH